LLAGATHLRWSGTFGHARDVLDVVEEKVKGLTTECETALASEATEEPPVDSDSGKKGSSRIARIINRIKPEIIPMLLLVIMTSSVWAATGKIFLDNTDSVEPAQREAALKMLSSVLSAELPALSTQAHISEWEVFRFADDSLVVVPFTTVSVPPRVSDPSLDAAKCQEEVPHLATTGEKNEWIRQCEERKKAAKAEAGAKYNDAKAKYGKELDDALVVSDPKKKGCTAFWDLLVRISRFDDHTFSIVVTDGEDTCTKSNSKDTCKRSNPEDTCMKSNPKVSIPKIRLQPRSNSSRVVIVLLYTRKKSDDQREQILHAIQTVAPWVKVTSLDSHNLGLVFGEPGK
jgi:hypothetical protein